MTKTQKLTMKIRNPAPDWRGSHFTDHALHEEIAFLEKRLMEMIDAAESSCERLLIRAYRDLLMDRKKQLCSRRIPSV
jgi:hypothetical protein